MADTETVNTRQSTLYCVLCSTILSPRSFCTLLLQAATTRLSSLIQPTANIAISATYVSAVILFHRCHFGIAQSLISTRSYLLHCIPLEQLNGPKRVNNMDSWFCNTLAYSIPSSLTSDLADHDALRVGIFRLAFLGFFYCTSGMLLFCIPYSLLPRLVRCSCKTVQLQLQLAVSNRSFLLDLSTD